MKSINATLLTNQKLPNGRPYATASLADNNRLHPTAVSGTAAYTLGKTIGVECGTFYVRVRYTASGANTLDVQKITDPTVASQWTTWTNLVASNVGPRNSVAIFWTGTYCVVVWQDTPSVDLKYKRSSDGISWSATAVVRTGLVAALSAGGASGTSPDCGVMEAYNSQIYWQSYNDSTNTWAAAASAGATFTTAAPEIAAFKDTINSRYIAAVAVSGYVNWASFAIIIYTRATGSNTWSTGQVLFSSTVASFGGLNFAQRQVNGYWWLSFYKARLWDLTAASHFLLSASNDGLYYDDPMPSPVTGNQYSATLLPAPSAGTWANAYFGLEAELYRIDSYTYWSNATVVGYHFLTGRSGHQEGGGVNSKGGVSPTVPSTDSTIVALLDNRTGALTTPRLYTVFTLTRGLVIDGVQRGQSAGAWYVTGFRYLQGDGLLEITATDARGLLATWFADTAYVYRGNTIKFLVERICALAGVHTCTFDANAAWTDVVTAYTHPVGENALFSLQSLSERLPFEYVPQEDGSLSFYVPTASPSSLYTFGSAAGEHAAWLSYSPKQTGIVPPSLRASRSWQLNTPPWFGSTESVTYIQDIGTPPKTRVAETYDQTQLNDLGRRRSLIINDRRLNTDAMVTAALVALLAAAKERKRAGVFAAPPSFSLEPGDVVTLNSGASTYAQTNGLWRVEQIEEHFNLDGAQPFHQLITVRGTT